MNGAGGEAEANEGTSLLGQAAKETAPARFQMHMCLTPCSVALWMR